MRFWLILLFSAPLFLHAQIRCGFDSLLANTQRSQTQEQFSQWLHKKSKLNTTQSLFSEFFGEKKAAEIYELPIVFHIIHTGQSIGAGYNLSDERIIDQVDRLNKDFRRLNDDADNTPSEFLDVAVDTEIEFVMARQDPEGRPSSGITRTEVSQTSFKTSEIDILTSLIQWPPEDYINVYVLNLESYLGLGMFPFSDEGGLKNEIENLRETDGVYIRYTYFGFNDSEDDNLAFTSYGRTLTHELGHYLGVLHTFHGGCTSTNDYCADTPALSNSTLNINESCGDIPNTSCESGERPMVENYMDYTDDVCMNLFTQDQKERMRTVLQYSPRRKSLLSSPALELPVLVNNDMGIREIRSPLKTDCSNEFIPSIQVRNYGSNDVNSFKISVKQNGQIIEVRDFNIALTPDELEIVSFSPMTITSEDFTDISFEVIEVNDVADGKNTNNIQNITINPGETTVLPYMQSFDNDVAFLARTQLNEVSQWQVVTAADSVALNQAAGLAFYEFEDDINYGVKDFLYTDVLDVSSLNSALLTFKYAYSGRISGEYLDELIVAISTDCGSTFEPKNYLFQRKGNSLISTSKTDVSFVPTSVFDWEQVDINITSYLEYDNIQIAFIGVNGGGNNLYVDDIQVNSSNLLSHDAGIRRLESAGVVTCFDDILPSLNVRNFGYKPIDQMKVSLNLNGAGYDTVYSGLNLRSGDSEEFRFDFGKLEAGLNELFFSIDSVNDTLDAQTSNNLLAYKIYVDDSRDTIPVRQTFESEGTDDWVINEVNGEPLFELVEITGRNRVLRATAYDTAKVGTQTYFVSPNINTNQVKQGAIRFKLSYAERAGYTDNLKILLSLDCGANYNIEVYNKNTKDMATTSSEQPWVPTDELDWVTEFVDITEHMIWNNLRIAFVFTNGQGNNLYLDDIELLTSNDPNQPIPEFNMSMYPNPATDRFYLSFKVPEKQTVNVKMVDMTGRIVLNQYIENVLNQKLEIVTTAEKGFYLVMVTGPDVRMTQRIYIR
ncbi:MAG: M43 family zinc metalloprotease [Cyclobacteriaceae bacterium]